jgi:chromosomal replication initiation ATPase DnaA
MTSWDQILGIVRSHVPEEDFRHWFGATAYASDSGDQITVWVPSEAIRRHLINNFQDDIDRALGALDRAGTHVRLVVGGMDEDDEEEKDV